MLVVDLGPQDKVYIELSKDDIFKYFKENPEAESIKGFVLNTAHQGRKRIGFEFPRLCKIKW